MCWLIRFMWWIGRLVVVKIGYVVDDWFYVVDRIGYVVIGGYVVVDY